MIRLFTLALGLALSATVFGQDTKLDTKVSLKDSILLKEFWTEFKDAVITKNKTKLAALCKFPFDCQPCISDTTLNNNGDISIKVTEKRFNDGQYKLFFERPIRDEVNKHKSFDIHIFYLFPDDKSKPKEFMLSYTIVAPSKTWEGMQGLIYLDKIKGRYKITGIDTIP